MCIYGFISHLKCSFNIFRRKKKKIFPCRALLLYVVHEVFIEVPLFQETCPAPKNSSFRACNFKRNFHPDFHPNIWVFASLPIYRKLIHDIIYLVFGKPRISCFDVESMANRRKLCSLGGNYFFCYYHEYSHVYITMKL